MNRRQLFSTFLAAPVAALAAGKETPNNLLPLTTHDHKVLSLLYNNLYTYMKWENKDSLNRLTNEALHQKTYDMMQIFRDQYQKSIIRHVAGVQPLSHPTGFLYVEGTFPGLKSPNSPNNPYIHIEYDWRVMSKYIKTQFDPPKFSHTHVFTQTAQSRFVNTFELCKTLDQQIINWMALKENSISETELNSFSRLNGSFIIAHPKNKYVTRLFNPTHIFLTEHAPEDKLIVGRKTSEFDAPVFYGPYIPLIGNGQKMYSFKFNEKTDTLSLINTTPLMKTRYLLRSNPLINYNTKSYIFKV